MENTEPVTSKINYMCFNFFQKLPRGFYFFLLSMSQQLFAEA